MLMIDHSIIATHTAPAGRFAVLGQRDEVVFRDGSAVYLHPVQRNDLLCPLLRAVQSEGLVWTVFDLRHTSDSIERDVIGCHRVDEPGIVYYTLRLGYPSARAFIDRVAGHILATWWRDVPQQVAA